MNNTNKKTIKLVLRIVVAFLFLLLAIFSVTLPFTKARVNITGDAVPYNSSVYFNAISAYTNINRYYDEIAKSKDISSLPKKDIAKLGYAVLYSGGYDDEEIPRMENLGAYSLIGSIINPKSALGDAGVMWMFCAIFVACALLTGLSGSRISFGTGIGFSVLLAVKLIRTVVSLAGIPNQIIQNNFIKRLDITYYGFASTPWYYLMLILLFIVVAVSAFAISLSVGSEARAYSAPPVNKAAGNQKPAPAPAPGNNNNNNINNHCLTCVRGDQKGGRFTISSGEEIVIGRDGEVANIVVVAPKISRKHCVIRYDRLTNTYHVTDCSTNGTYNADNGQRLTYGADTTLACGTIISLGNSENQFRLD